MSSSQCVSVVKIIIIKTRIQIIVQHYHPRKKLSLIFPRITSLYNAIATLFWMLLDDLVSLWYSWSSCLMTCCLCCNCWTQTVIRCVRQMTGQQVNATSVVCDFEMSILLAVNTELPNAEICVCYFHFTQSLWRKISDLGLASAYHQHSRVRKLLRKVMALAFLPLALVRNNVMLLLASPEWRSASRHYHALNDFMAYFTRTYMNDNGHFPPRMWNVYKRDVNTRTNNYMEGMDCSTCSTMLW